MKTLPKKDSGILKAQIVQILLIVSGLIGVALSPEDIEAIAVVFLLCLQFGPVAWTWFCRMFRANPPMTETAVKKEEAFQAAPQKT